MSLERGGLVTFCGWLLTGAVISFFGLSMPAVGLPVLLVAAAIATWWSWRTALPGLLVGVSLPLLRVAWNNRGGPGYVEFTTDTGGGGYELLDPVPWLLVGLGLLAVAGLLLVAGLLARRSWYARRRVSAPGRPVGS